MGTGSADKTDLWREHSSLRILADRVAFAWHAMDAFYYDIGGTARGAWDPDTAGCPIELSRTSAGFTAE